jgi:acyl-CoA reductase-like NAD-dependent aldehyde dehydrogenase
MNTLAHAAEANTTAPCNICTIAPSPDNTTAQSRWAATPIRHRLRILRETRLRLAEQSTAIAQAISPNLIRSQADTLVAELLPLLDAIRFLERNAARILAPRKLGRSGRPLWLTGVHAEIHREPLGHILVIAPANFPLFLAGTQVLQALAAGNAVTWKPGANGRPIANLVAETLTASGLPSGLLTITPDTIEAAHQALATAPDKVLFTGSHATGTAILTQLALTTTPAVVELSGADAIIVLPYADLALVAQAVAFGLRLNGSAVCMSPRRLFASESTLNTLRPLLLEVLANVPAVTLNDTTAHRLTTLIDEAVSHGANILGQLTPLAQRPILIDNATPQMSITRADIFAPVLSLLAVPSLLHLRDAYAACPYALTAAIFCSPDELPKARTLAATLRAGTVLINDIIAPTADPRVPFTGRAASGYGATRGAEGLLEMTALKTLLVRKRGTTRHYTPTTNADAPTFTHLIQATHGRTHLTRLKALKNFFLSANNSSRKPPM